MNTNDFAKRIIERIKNPQEIPSMIVRVLPSGDDPLMIEGEPDDLLEVVTPNGSIVGQFWRSYWDAL
jgi:hypothetical protein